MWNNDFGAFSNSNTAGMSFPPISSRQSLGGADCPLTGLDFTRGGIATFQATGVNQGNVQNITGLQNNNRLDRHYMINVSNYGATGDVRGDIRLASIATQALVEQAIWGIPFLHAVDPSTGGAQTNKDGTGPWRREDWPGNNYINQTGYGAIGCINFIYDHAVIHSNEYKGHGRNIKFGPMIDTLTEPRWSRARDIWSADYAFSAEAGLAYIRAMQGVKSGKGNTWIRGGLASMVKHTPGSGNNAGGTDSHSTQGIFHAHVPRFEAGNPNIGRFGVLGDINWPGMKLLLDAAGRVMMESYPLATMPCYGTYADPWQQSYYIAPSGRVIRPTSNVTITHCYDFMIRTLREEWDWDGLIGTDYGAFGHFGAGNANFQDAFDPINNPLGTGLGSGGLNLRKAQGAILRIHNIGGGGAAFTNWQDAHTAGVVSRDWLEHAAAKQFEVMFKLGLFENPYGGTGSMQEFIDSRREGFSASLESQRRALVLLKNTYGDPVTGTEKVLPLAMGPITTTGLPAGTDLTGQTIFFHGRELGTNQANIRNAFDRHDVPVAQVTSGTGAGAVALQEAADIQIIRVVGRHGCYPGMRGGVPMSFQASQFAYIRQFQRHSHILEYLDRMANDAITGDRRTINETTRLTLPLRDYVVTANHRASIGAVCSGASATYDPPSSPDQTKFGMGHRIFNAIERKKPGSKLVLVVDHLKPWTFGQRFTGVENPDWFLGVEQVPAIMRYSNVAWVGGNYNGTNLFNPATDGLRIFGSATPGATTWTVIDLVTKIRNGGLTSTTELPNGVVRGVNLYVDPIAARQWVINPASLTPEETNALRKLECNQFQPGRNYSNTNDGNTSWATWNRGTSLWQVEFIDNPLQYIDALVVNYGITDANLIAALFGRNGILNHTGEISDAPFSPSGTLPHVLYNSDTQLEFTWGDIPNEIPSARRLINPATGDVWDNTEGPYRFGIDHNTGKDHLGFMFGFRAGLMNWERGQASAICNTDWTWDPITYTNSLPTGGFGR
jgi:beta-glucosidase-like glycosyl hydrolase